MRRLGKLGINPMQIEPTEPLFVLGCICVTRGALDVLDRTSTNAEMLLNWHRCGRWGDICEADINANWEALGRQFRILSAYGLGLANEKLWVITEADRSATTLLLPEEY